MEIMIEKSQALLLLSKWEQVRHDLDVVLENLKTVHGEYYDSPLWNALEENFDAYTDALQWLLDGESAIKDGPSDWLHWYFAENDMGRKALYAGYDGQNIRVKNIEDLWLLIEIGRSR